MAAGVVHQNASHDVGSDAEEVGPILPVDLALIDQSDEDLMDKGGGLQGVVRPLAAKLPGRHATEFRIDQRQ